MYQNLHFFRELKYSRRFWDAAMAEFWDVASGPAGSAAAGIALEMETRRAGSSRLRTPGPQLTTRRRYRRRRRRTGPETDRRSNARRSTRRDLFGFGGTPAAATAQEIQKRRPTYPHKAMEQSNAPSEALPKQVV